MNSPGWTVDKQDGEVDANIAKLEETIYRSSVLPSTVPPPGGLRVTGSQCGQLASDSVRRSSGPAPGRRAGARRPQGPPGPDSDSAVPPVPRGRCSGGVTGDGAPPSYLERRRRRVTVTGEHISPNGRRVGRPRRRRTRTRTRGGLRFTCRL